MPDTVVYKPSPSNSLQCLIFFDTFQVKNDAENCDGIYDALGICVCGKEIRTLGFVGTYSDSSCTEVVEELPRPKIPTEACFHLSAFYWKSLDFQSRY